MGLYDDVKARGIQHANHYSDLYIPVNAETRELLRVHGITTAKVFTNQVEGGLWYNTPFQYSPYWEDKQKRR